MKQQILYWLQACRLRTLPLAIATVGLGSALAYYEDCFSVLIFVWVLLTAIGLQLLSNLANDVGDSQHGIDHTARRGPLRMAASGYLSVAALQRGMAVVAAATLGCGLSVLWHAFGVYSWYFWGFLGLGLLSLWAALRYAYGTRPYGHGGWGDVAVWVCFGLVGVQGSYFLYTQSWIPGVWLPAAAMGASAVVVLNINNLRDIDSDVAAGKRSIAARLGPRGAVCYHRLLLLGAMCCYLVYAYLYLPMGWGWLFISTYPAYIWAAYAVGANSSAQVLNRRLPQMASLILLLVLAFTVGIWLSKTGIAFLWP